MDLVKKESVAAETTVEITYTYPSLSSIERWYFLESEAKYYR
jgi:hypothetical protein